MLADRWVVLDEEESDGQWKIKGAVQAWRRLEAGRYYYSSLESQEGQPARDYLARRGIDRTIYRTFGLGFALDRWDDLFQYLKSKGFDESAMIDAGLIRRSSKNTWNDIIRGRVMFPVINAQGRILAFEDVTSAMTVQNTSTSGNLVYQKATSFDGLAQRARSEEIIVVEGYMDVIALARAGVKNAVAPLGTALTPYQAQLQDRLAAFCPFRLDRAGTEAGCARMKYCDRQMCLSVLFY